MKENRNDLQFGQTSTGQQQNRGNQSNEKMMNSEGSSGYTVGSEPFDPEELNTYVDQPQERGSRSNEGTFGSEGSPSSFSGRERSGEYSSDDELNEMDEMDDEDMVSRADEDEEEDDLMGDDENSRINQRGR